MSSKRVRVGDLIAIPVAPGTVAAAKVIYTSNLFKNVIALRLVDRVFDHVPTGDEVRAASFMSGVIYTGSQGIGKLWPTIGHSPSLDGELELTRRLIASDIYVCDENIGKASPDDRRALRPMGVAGMYAVHDYILRRLKLK